MPQSAVLQEYIMVSHAENENNPGNLLIADSDSDSSSNTSTNTITIMYDNVKSDTDTDTDINTNNVINTCNYTYTYSDNVDQIYENYAISSDKAYHHYYKYMPIIVIIILCLSIPFIVGNIYYAINSKCATTVLYGIVSLRNHMLLYAIYQCSFLYIMLILLCNHELFFLNITKILLVINNVIIASFTITGAIINEYYVETSICKRSDPAICYMYTITLIQIIAAGCKVLYNYNNKNKNM